MATRPLPPSAVRTMTMSEATAHLDGVIDSIATGEDDVIIQRDGVPQVAIISMDDYRELQENRIRARQAESARRFAALAKKVRERNADLSESEAAELAQQLAHDLREERYLETMEHLTKNSTKSDSSG